MVLETCTLFEVVASKDLVIVPRDVVRHADRAYRRRRDRNALPGPVWFETHLAGQYQHPRAVRQCGELLKQVERVQGTNLMSSTPLSQAIESSGLSVS